MKKTTMSEECYTMKDGTFIPMCMGAAARGKDYCTCKTMTKAELRQQLAAKEQELAELRTQLEQMDDERLSWKREAESRGGENAELRERNEELERRFREGCIKYTDGDCLCQENAELREQIADNHKRAEEIIAARVRQIERLREEVKEEHERYIESCKNTAIQKSVRHKLEQENEELRRDRDFLLDRASRAGHCSFSDERDTGMSSNSIVSIAYGRTNLKHQRMPMDRGDLAACERAFAKLPEHRKTNEVKDALNRARAAIRHSQEDREGEG